MSQHQKHRKDNNMSAPTAAKIINQIDFKTGKLPQVLAIDEFKGNAEGEKFQCILADPKNHKVIDILPNRRHEMIRHHIMIFSNRKEVKLVVMDMTGGYRKLMKELFPHAKIIVDKYHYVMTDRLCTGKNTHRETKASVPALAQIFQKKQVSSVKRQQQAHHGGSDTAR